MTALVATLRSVGLNTYLIVTSTQANYLDQVASYPANWEVSSAPRWPQHRAFVRSWLTPTPRSTRSNGRPAPGRAR